jgi:hypothetical protein
MALHNEWGKEYIAVFGKLKAVLIVVADESPCNL